MRFFVRESMYSLRELFLTGVVGSVAVVGGVSAPSFTSTFGAAGWSAPLAVGGDLTSNWSEPFPVGGAFGGVVAS